LCFPGTLGALTKTPQNVVVLRGEDAILNCSTDSVSQTGQNPITWNYDNGIISYRPCTSQSPGFVASPLPDSATDCNIRALGSGQHGISGAYRCSDKPFGTQGLAMVIVLGERQCRVSLITNYFVICLLHPPEKADVTWQVGSKENRGENAKKMAVNNWKKWQKLRQIRGKIS